MKRDLNPQHPSNDEPLDPTEAMGLDLLDELDDMIEQSADHLDGCGF